MIHVVNYIESESSFYLKYTFTGVFGTEETGEIKRTTKRSLMLAFAQACRDFIMVRFDFEGISWEGIEEMEISSFCIRCNSMRYTICTQVATSKSVFQALRKLHETLIKLNHETEQSIDIPDNGELAA